ncbi:MAG: hypothetical protein IPG67_12655 [Acidobacteria bacterium]|nr:hypothetical protein [Acidobacteriota bacterium]
MKSICTAIIASAFILILSLDASAQKRDRSQNTNSTADPNRSSAISISVDPMIDTPQRVRRTSTNSTTPAIGGRISGIAIDPSDPSGNTVPAQSRNVRVKRVTDPSRSLIGVQGMMGQQQTTVTSTSNVVQGNYIGTNRRSRIGPEIHGN